MPKIPTGSIDMIMTDPPYNLKLFNTSWDKALPSKEAFQEMFRVLKPGAFCFVFSSPRQDLLYRMTRLIEEAGFMVDFPSIYWTYATGIGLAANVSKVIDKRAGKERKGEIKKGTTRATNYSKGLLKEYETGNPITDLAKEFDGAYIRYRPKPCLEIILVAMKPAEKYRRSDVWEKYHTDYFFTKRKKGGDVLITRTAMNPELTDDKLINGIVVESEPYKNTILSDYATQVMMNGHACTWLDRCRVPVSDGTLAGWRGGASAFGTLKGRTGESREANRGRYPTNLLVQHDLLDTGEVTRSNGGDQANRSGALHGSKNAISLESTGLGDSGSFSRYFCFDSWCREKLPKTYPFLPVPKPSASTKVGREAHLTEKPVQIFAYLVTLASRPGDLIGDFYAGSGSSLLAAAGMNRDFIGCDKVAEHVKMAEQRLSVLLVNREKKEITS